MDTPRAVEASTRRVMYHNRSAHHSDTATVAVLSQHRCRYHIGGPCHSHTLRALPSSTYTTTCHTRACSRQDRATCACPWWGTSKDRLQPCLAVCGEAAIWFEARGFYTAQPGGRPHRRCISAMHFRRAANLSLHTHIAPHTQTESATGCAAASLLAYLSDAFFCARLIFRCTRTKQARSALTSLATRTHTSREPWQSFE